MELALKKLITDFIEQQSNFHDHRHSKKYFIDHLSNIERGLAGKTSCFYRYGITQGEVEYFDYAVPSKDLSKEYVSLLYCYSRKPRSTRELRDLFSMAMDAYPGREYLVIGLDSSQQELLKKLKPFQPRLIAYELMGSPKMSLQTLKKQSLPEGMVVRPVDYHRDIKRIMSIEVGAHHADPTSRMQRMSPSFKNELKQHHKSMAEQGSSFVLEKERELLGVIGTYPRKPIALLATISIDPKYQGLGLSRYLYRAALKDLVRRKCPLYKGMTSTKNVMLSAQRMGRQVAKTYYEMKWSS